MAASGLAAAGGGLAAAPLEGAVWARAKLAAPQTIAPAIKIVSIRRTDIAKSARLSL
jgi:hypothetical protein